MITSEIKNKNEMRRETILQLHIRNLCCKTGLQPQVIAIKTLKSPISTNVTEVLYTYTKQAKKIWSLPLSHLTN